MKSEADAGSAELDSTADDSSEQEVMDLYGSVDQMLSEIEDEDEGDADPEAEGTEDGDEPSDEDEGDEPESVQPAATTAADAKIERLEAQIGSLTAAIEGLLKAQAEKPAPKPVPVEDTEEPPEGATARELVSFYAKQAAREEARKTVDEGMAPLRPALEQRKFLDTMASSYEALLTAGELGQEFGNKEAASLLGVIIENDADLLDIARQNPKQALRLASRSALDQLAKAREQKRAAATATSAPRSRANGSSPGSRRALSALDIANAALAEAKRGA
jgi:hypothetical protein